MGRQCSKQSCFSSPVAANKAIPPTVRHGEGATSNELLPTIADSDVIKVDVSAAKLTPGGIGLFW